MEFFKGNNFEFNDLYIVQSENTTIQSRRSVRTSTILGFNPLIPASMSYLDDYGRNEFRLKVTHWGGLCLPSRESGRKSPVSFNDTPGMTISYEELKNYIFNFDDRAFYAPLPIVSVDIANGALIEEKVVGEFLEKHSNVALILGNFGNPHAPKKFSKDIQERVIFKFGIGSGENCSTKLTTGVSYPQAALIYDARSENPNIIIISDGGIRKPADYVKAIALGADFVMAGSIFRTCVEANSWELVENEFGHSRYDIRTHGMASAKEKGSTSYVEGFEKVEHVETLTTVSEVYQKYEEGLRSAMSYCDASNLTEFRENVQMLNLKSR